MLVRVDLRKIPYCLCSLYSYRKKIAFNLRVEPDGYVVLSRRRRVWELGRQDPSKAFRIGAMSFELRSNLRTKTKKTKEKSICAILERRYCNVTVSNKRWCSRYLFRIPHQRSTWFLLICAFTHCFLISNHPLASTPRYCIWSSIGNRRRLVFITSLTWIPTAVWS